MVILYALLPMGAAAGGTLDGAVDSLADLQNAALPLFRALIVSKEPVGVTGAVLLQSASSVDLRLRPGASVSAPDSILDASELTFVVYESTWKTMELGGRQVVTVPTRESTVQTGVLQEATIQGVSTREASEWSTSVVKSGKPSIRIAPECSLQPVESFWSYWGINGWGDHGNHTEKPPLIDHRGATQRLKVECRASTIETDQKVAMTFRETSLVFRGRDAASPGSATASISIQAETTSTPNPALPGETEHRKTWVVAELRPSGPLHLPVGRTFNVTAFVDEAYAIGELTIPASNGSITWGQDRWDLARGEAPTERPSGVIHAKTRPGAILYLDGRTWNSATRPEAPSVPLPESSVTALLALAAATVGALVALRRLAGRLGLGFLGLFSRLHQDKVLDLERRREILDFIMANPGTSVQAVARNFGLHWPHVNYHIKVLESNAQVSVVRAGRRLALFARGAMPPDRQARFVALQKKHVPELLAALRNDPGRTQAELASRIGVSQRYVSSLLSALALHGLVKVELREGRRKYVPAAPIPEPTPP